MAPPDEGLISRLASMNEGRMGTVLEAFAVLLPASWPVTISVEALSKPSAARLTASQASRLLLQAFDEIQSTHPTAAFWWKDEGSVFLGACSRLGKVAGLPDSLSLLGITDSDERLPWARQAPLYRRDDREVLQRYQAKLNIVERQDRDTGVIWLRTSKVPYRNGAGQMGTVGGFDQISEARAKELANTAATVFKPRFG